MKKKIVLLTAGLLFTAMLTACGTDSAITEFKYEIDSFCTTISEIDTSINNIDAQADNATILLLGYLDDLNSAFQDFAELDFPEEFDYLENVADEAGSYMNEAVENYEKAYHDGYNKTLAEYAKENYARAYKRIQVIIACLHGDEPNADLTATTVQ